MRLEVLDRNLLLVYKSDCASVAEKDLDAIGFTRLSPSNIVKMNGGRSEEGVNVEGVTVRKNMEPLGKSVRPRKVRLQAHGLRSGQLRSHLNFPTKVLCHSPNVILLGLEPLLRITPILLDGFIRLACLNELDLNLIPDLKRPLVYPRNMLIRMAPKSTHL